MAGCGDNVLWLRAEGGNDEGEEEGDGRAAQQSKQSKTGCCGASALSGPGVATAERAMGEDYTMYSRVAAVVEAVG